MPEKKRAKHINPTDLFKLAEEQLNCGRPEEAIQNLLLVEKYSQPRFTPNGKKITIPPHLAVAQAATPPLLARALSERAMKKADPKQKLEDLVEAIKYAPKEIRYHIGAGSCKILLGKSEEAVTDFEKAEELQTGDDLALRARLLGLLGSGRHREAQDLLNLCSESRGDASWRRLLAIQQLSAGEAIARPVSASEGGQLLSGLSHLARGSNDLAFGALTSLPAMDQNPSRPEAAQIATQLFYNGWISFNERRYKASFDALREAERLSQSRQLSLPWRNRLAILYHKIAECVMEENLPLAVECWKESLKLSPDDKTAQANLRLTKQALANSAWTEGKTEVALGLWGEMLKADPHNEVLIRNLAVGYEKLERKTEALTHWRQLAHTWRRQSKSRLGEPGFKERLLKVEERVISLMIETETASHQIANELENSVKIDPDNLDLRRRIVEQLLEIGKPQASIKHLDVIERESGPDSETLMHRAMALDMADRHAEAGKAFEAALALDPSNSLTRRNYLVFLTQETRRAAKRGNTKSVIEICERQLSLDPNFEPALAQLASFYLDYRKADAKPLLDRIIANDPENPRNHALVGSIYLGQNMRKEAEQEFKEALDLDSGPLSSLVIGSMYLDLEEVKTALRYFDRAAKLAKKNDFEFLLDIANRLMEAGYEKEIYRYLDIAIRLDPSNPIPHVIKALSKMRDPINLVFDPKARKDTLKELNEAQRLAAASDEYKELALNIEDLKSNVEDTPTDINDFIRELDADGPYRARRKRSRKTR